MSHRRRVEALKSAFNIKRGFVMFVNGLMKHVQYCMTKYSVAYSIECIRQQNSYMSIKIKVVFRIVTLVQSLTTG